MTRMTTPNRFGIRLALVTGTTVATIVGAQTLASLDATAFSQNDIPAQISAPSEVLPAESDPSLIYTPPLDEQINGVNTPATNASPNIAIIRHSSERSASALAVNPAPSTFTAPPVTQVASPIISASNPAVVPAFSAPAPVAQSVPAPVTRSSR